MDDAGQTFTHRQVPPKTLHPPTTVSPQLRRSISNLAAAPRLAMDRMPQTVEQWRAFVSTADAQALALAPILEKLFAHTVNRRPSPASPFARSRRRASTRPRPAGC